MTSKGVGWGSLLNLNANEFTMIKMNISLTLYRRIMISVILLELGFHLLICTGGQVVIFYAITGSERYDLLRVLSIYPNSICRELEHKRG